MENINQNVFPVIPHKEVGIRNIIILVLTVFAIVELFIILNTSAERDIYRLDGAFAYSYLLPYKQIYSDANITQTKYNAYLDARTERALILLKQYNDHNVSQLADEYVRCSFEVQDIRSQKDVNRQLLSDAFLDCNNKLIRLQILQFDIMQDRYHDMFVKLSEKYKPRSDVNE